MAQPKLKLVSNNTVAPHPRPFETLYYSNADYKPEMWSAKGRAASVRGACRAAFMRVIEHRADKAVVHDASGTVVARVWREGRAVHATGSAIIKGVLL
jgi:hypothetical protein